ncbi:acyl-CoA dehydrogenase family protein [Pseudonocardia sp.]|jgi:acyl-CoA dehydrogenase|uniref:acyl-CoA dehydrogenase family protein n=1 Tax=Pseudonocardia sp. TaxID=60912 RepID=UPI003D14972F
MVEQDELERFEADAETFLSAHVPLRKSGAEWSVGSDAVSSFTDATLEEARAEVRVAKAWRALEFDAGFGWITGPVEWGGRGLDNEFQWSYWKVRSRYEVPDENPLVLALGMVGPTVLAHGQDALRREMVTRIFRGEIAACQLFSEPGAGSDLAAVQTRAVPVEGGWKLNGQKVWTSGAHVSDVGEVLARTDPEAPKHRGITAFLIDMLSPGVEIRPLRQMTGGAHFNEVFLNDVFVPDDRRLGDVNAGWAVAVTTLLNERANLGSGGADSLLRHVRLLIALARRRGRAGDPVVQQRIAELYEQVTASELVGERALAQVRAGREPGPELSVSKLLRSDSMKRLNDLASLLLGSDLIADSGEWGTFAWAKHLLGTPGAALAGGTDEVQRNIIAERVLGLPR